MARKPVAVVESERPDAKQYTRKCGKGETPDDGVDAAGRAVPDAIEPPRLGHVMTRSGLVHLAYVNGELKETWLSDPFEVLGQTRTTDSHGWGIAVKWTDQDRREHRLIFPKADLVKDANGVIGAFLDGGLRIASKKYLRDLFAAYFDRIADKVRLTCVRRLGLTEDRKTFVLPDRNFGENADKVVLQSVRGQPNFAQKGTLAAWRAGIAARAVDNHRLAFVLCVGLVGPLAALMGEEVSGFHLVGGSSSGKTTLLRAAASVWGAGEIGGFMRSWRATDNGLEGIAAVHNDTLLVLDEINQAAAKTISESAYMLANGSGKLRADRLGGARDPATWRVPFLSSGEETLDKVVRDATPQKRAAKAGQVVRVIDIPADAGVGLGVFDHADERNGEPDRQKAGAQLSDAIKATATSHYGHAGSAFVEKLMENPEAHIKSARETVKAVMAAVQQNGSEMGSQARRVANRFALAAAAGELATKFGITGWEAGEATRAATACFEAWCSRVAPSASIESQTGVQAVRAFLSQHSDARFDRISPNGDLVEDWRPVHNRAGFVRGAGDQREWLILRDVFDEITGGQSTETAKALKAMGALVTAKEANLASKARSPLGRGDKRARFYVVTNAIFATAGDVSDDDGDEGAD